MAISRQLRLDRDEHRLVSFQIILQTIHQQWGAQPESLVKNSKLILYCDGNVFFDGVDRLARMTEE
jgi:hypothetical protein